MSGSGRSCGGIHRGRLRSVRGPVPLREEAGGWSPDGSRIPISGVLYKENLKGWTKMTKKYRAAALTVAILAAVLAASSPAAASPVAGQWRQYSWEQGVYNWHQDYGPYWRTDSDGSFGAGCYYQPPYVFVVGLAAPTEAPTGPTPAEYSTDGGLTWRTFLRQGAGLRLIIVLHRHRLLTRARPTRG